MWRVSCHFGRFKFFQHSIAVLCELFYMQFCFCFNVFVGESEHDILLLCHFDPSLIFSSGSDIIRSKNQRRIKMAGLEIVRNIQTPSCSLITEKKQDADSTEKTPNPTGRGPHAACAKRTR